MAVEYRKATDMTLKQQVEAIELTEQELKEAIYEGKKKKFFHEKNKHHWPEEKPVKPKGCKNPICDGGCEPCPAIV